MIFRTIPCWVRNAMLRKLTLSEFIGFLAPRPRELARILQLRLLFSIFSVVLLRYCAPVI